MPEKLTAIFKQTVDSDKARQVCNNVFVRINEEEYEIHRNCFLVKDYPEEGRASIYTVKEM